MKKTKIEWCDSTWNPVTGCLHGCKYCYAQRIANRFSGRDGITTKAQTMSFMNKKQQWCHEVNSHLTRKTKTGEVQPAPFPYGFEPTFHRYRLDEPQRWKKPQTVFVCSMADLFGEWVPDSWIDEVFAACNAAPQHRYLFLTKNPRRICQLANEKKLPKRDNWWYGSTIDNMKAVTYPGRLTDHTFVSIEPLMEYMNVGIGSFGSAEWVIIGAETGNRKGKVIPEKAWVDKICEAAAITHMAVFMKDSLIPIVGEENMRKEPPWKMEAEQALMG